MRMSEELEKGNRVKLSAKGVAAGLIKPQRLGTVTKWSLHREYIYVLWDGTITPTRYHPSFIEVTELTPVLPPIEAQGTHGPGPASLYLGEEKPT